MYEVKMKITFFTFQRQQWETKLQLGACWKGRWWPETGHKLVSTMAWYFAWKYAWITGPMPAEFFLGQRNAWLNTGISHLTLQIYLPNTGWGGHLHGNHVQHILRVDANKFGTRNWKCFAGTKLCNWEIVARNAARWDSLLPCFLDLEMLVGCTGFGIFCCIYFSLFRLRPYIGLACGRWGWLDLIWWPETLRICNDWVPDALLLKIFSVKFELGNRKVKM